MCVLEKETEQRWHRERHSVTGRKDTERAKQVGLQYFFARLRGQD